MWRTRIGIWGVTLLLLQNVGGATKGYAGGDPIEPQAGTWKTWVLASGSQLRLPPPPDTAATAAEITQLQAMATTRDAAALDQIAYWDTGAPSYRWNDITVNEGLKNNLAHNLAARHLALVHIAIYDALIASWESKYTYWASRPFQRDPTFKPLFTTPNHPSYPAAHGCASSAPAAVLASLFPRDADALNAMADQAAESRIWAGIHFRSDVVAGLALGRQVAGKVIERAQRDGAP